MAVSNAVEFNVRSPVQDLRSGTSTRQTNTFLCVRLQLLGLFGVTLQGMKRQTHILKILTKSHDKVKHKKACQVSLNHNIVLLASEFPIQCRPAAPNKLKQFFYNPRVNNKHH